MDVAAEDDPPPENWRAHGRRAALLLLADGFNWRLLVGVVESPDERARVLESYWKHEMTTGVLVWWPEVVNEFHTGFVEVLWQLDGSMKRPKRLGLMVRTVDVRPKE